MKNIRFCGIGKNWSEDQARQRANLVNEIGYVSRVIILGKYSIVAHSHKTFTLNEALKVLHRFPKKEFPDFDSNTG